MRWTSGAFRTGSGRGASPHQALDALNVGIARKRVNWILDADIQGFFDQHRATNGWMKFVEHRMADTAGAPPDPEMVEGGGLGGRRMVGDGRWDAARGGGLAAAGERLPALRLRSMGRGLARESGERRHDRRPLRRRSRGGVPARAEAERFLEEFRERLAKFGLEVHPEKTRLIEFGRYAEGTGSSEGEGKPETFTFLGFTHYCGENSKGYFHGVAADGGQADEGQAAAGEAGAARADA